MPSDSARLRDRRSPAQGQRLHRPDFGFLTSAGDPRLDAAIAASIMNMYGPHEPAITDVFTAHLADDLGRDPASREGAKRGARIPALNLNPASLPVRQVRLQRSPPTRAFVRPAPPAPRHGLDSVKGSRLRKDSSDQAINSIAFEQVKGSHPRTPGRQRRCALPQVRGLINDLGLSLGSSRSPSQISLTRCTGDSGTTAPVRDVCRMDPLAWAQGRPGHHTDHLAS